MTVGDVRTVARIRERQQAKREFEAAKSEGKSASLLEQSRPNVFSMQVANIMPGDTISVELRYTELLVPTDGVYEFVYPTVVGPRYSETREGQGSPGDEFVKAPYTHQGEAPRSEFHLAGLVSTGVPLQELASPTHRVTVRSGDAGRADLVLADSELFGGNRDFILRYRLAGAAIASGLLLYRGRDENFFLLMAEPPQAVEPSADSATRVHLRVDVSGSMFGFPLDTAKQLMRELANVLRPSDVVQRRGLCDGSDIFSPSSFRRPGQRRSRAAASSGPEERRRRHATPQRSERAVGLPRQAATSRSVVLVTDGYIDAEADVFDYVRGQLETTQRLRVRYRLQRQPVPDRGRRSRGTRRAVHRDGSR